MPENIKIKCPVCGAVLTVVSMPGIETKKIPCPICKTATKFTDYKKPTVKPVDDNDDETQTEGETEPADLNNYVIGKLQVSGSSTQYTLKIGKNIIGRKANSSTANVQIETTDKTMSRSHSLIEVVKLSKGGYKHYFSNANNKNATLVNNENVESDDKLILNGGEIIKMGNVVLKFTIAGGEDTDYTE